MSIKQFLILGFSLLLSLAIFLNIQYSKSTEFQKNNKPIENYSIVNLRHSYSSKMSSHIDINYNGKVYNVEVNKSKEFYADVEKGIIKPKFYYVKDKDKVFFENQFVPFPFVYLTYIAAFILPIIGFIVYRKELNNKYSTM
ncbi:hypothetical protein [Flavobacterium phycosphaerae]|uniref:hypothetical protein n=1 Tax=Flavobacterium phycosphaerae TaxID=2697515 RepID=UPI001389F0FD|nr:hypothetical protein [Flavobacterium phycosphaerae]